MFKDKKQKEKQQAATQRHWHNRATFLLQVSFPDTLNQATPVCKAMEV